MLCVHYISFSLEPVQKGRIRRKMPHNAYFVAICGIFVLSEQVLTIS